VVTQVVVTLLVTKLVTLLVTLLVMKLVTLLVVQKQKQRRSHSPREKSIGLCLRISSLSHGFSLFVLWAHLSFFTTTIIW
jgi:hypothetical protein